MKNFTHVFVPLVLIVVVYLYYRKHNTEVRMVKSTIDGERYLVQNKKDKQVAADTLAKLRRKLITLVETVAKRNPDHAPVNRLKLNFQPDRISEGTEDRKYTTYTLNKGEKIVFCLRSRDHQDRIHNLDLLYFVAIHELAHIMTTSQGHTEEFQKNFQWLLKEAKDAGLYTPVNYRKNPVKYCGIEVTDIPLADDEF